VSIAREYRQAAILRLIPGSYYLNQRKCRRSNFSSRCERCNVRDLDCTYAQAQRGRKPHKACKTTPTGKARSRSLSKGEAAPRSDSYSFSRPSCQQDVALHTVSPHDQSAVSWLAGRSTLTETDGKTLPAAASISHQSSPHPTATHFSLSRITEQAAAPESQVDVGPARSLATAFDGTQIEDIGSGLTGKTCSKFIDPIAKGLVVEFEVEALFTL
jgi:hypothetical protein